MEIHQNLISSPLLGSDLLAKTASERVFRAAAVRS